MDLANIYRRKGEAKIIINMTVKGKSITDIVDVKHSLNSGAFLFSKVDTYIRLLQHSKKGETK